MRPSVIVLTFNSEETLGATLSRALLVSDEIFVVDSGSSDRTVEIARQTGAIVLEHPFEHYGAQRNWAIGNLPITRPWQLHLDADEFMEDALVQSILGLPDDPSHSGYFLPRYVKFLGRVLRHGGMSPTWHLRLFRTGVGRCEDRKYDQHFLLTAGTTAQLRGAMIDDNRMPLTEWTARHNRWADSEVAELACQDPAGRVTPDAFGNPVQRKRFLRQIYNRAPLFVRSIALFGYRYFFRLGFLDGTEGLIYWVLQNLWYRFLVDAKMWEHRHIRTSS
jgi:glycosyltransferase involved in cell wall biosynthesis